MTTCSTSACTPPGCRCGNSATYSASTHTTSTATTPPAACLASRSSPLIELAARLDLHPADLVPALESVLTNRRQAPAAEPQPADLDTEALGVLAALATIGEPLTTDELTTALGWNLDRTTAALEHAIDRPHLAGPVALPRIPPGRWTVTPRRTLLLSTEQQQAGLHLGSAGGGRAGNPSWSAAWPGGLVTSRLSGDAVASR